MKNFKYLFLLTLIFSCGSNFDSISEEEVMIDSLKSELNSKDKVLKSLEFNKENNDSIVNRYALFIQKIKENIIEFEKGKSSSMTTIERQKFKMIKNRYYRNQDYCRFLKGKIERTV